MIPSEHSHAVVRALQEAFHVTGCEDISRITKGHTPSLVYRIVVQGAPYLLKIITRQENPSRHYDCMSAAAAAGLAPRVVYTSVEDKVSITAFVQPEPLPASGALARMPGVLRTLHALPPFARAPFNTTCTFLLNQGPALDGFLGRFRSAGILPDAVSHELFARYAELFAACPRDASDLVSCHNDLFKPDNILSDGHRLWLVDWEAAFLNDRYADLAVVANMLVTNDTEEQAFLRDYFGAPPAPYQSARLHLMRQLSHIFYTLAFVSIGAAGRPADWSGTVPGYAVCQRRMWAGELDLTDPDVKVLYGRVHWERLLHNVAQPRYRESLRTAAGEHGTP